VGLRRTSIKLMGRSHMAVYRLTHGRFLGRVAGMPVLLLTTTGRRSGRERTTPLTYFEDGNALVVVASNGGEDTPPAWWLNLDAQPEATIAIGTRSRSVTARAATGVEYERLWPIITATHPGYAAYARRTARPIPVVLLEPRNGSSE
jgi:deazaflavin-dependent oxidoreductase (nitroreductase family)